MRAPSAAEHLNFQRIFEFGPDLSLLLSPAQNYAIVAATNSYLRATQTTREEILGRSLFDFFPENSPETGATGTRQSLRASLEAVVCTGKPHAMAVQKYDIRSRQAAVDSLGERCWRSLNSPVLFPKGNVRYVIHRVEDVTEYVQLQQHGEHEERVSTILKLRAGRSESERFLQGQENADSENADSSGSRAAADGAQLEPDGSQPTKQAEQLRAANSSLRELTARLLQIRDEERRRIARELHDSIGQMLVAQGMYLSSVAAESRQLSVVAGKALKDGIKLIEEMSRELRTISYLLHPPLLDEVGLVSAIRWFAEGFAERSKIKVNLDLSDSIGRLSEESEIAIFRIVQECLTNIHRHSGSQSATIRLDLSPQGIILEIKDQGMGMSPETRNNATSGRSSGVGLRGMQERIAQLGGRIEITASANGTSIVARLPIVNASCSRAMATGVSASRCF